MDDAIPRAVVLVAGPEDTRAAIDNALRRAGCTFDELAQQARTGRFDSTAARMAWMAVGGYYGD
jgi:hypothetical protein